MNILGAKDVDEAVGCDFVGLENHLVRIVLDGAYHTFTAIHYFVLLYALKCHLKTQQKIQNVLIPFSLMLEENGSVFFLDSYLLVGLFLIEMLRHFPILKEESLKSILGFEVIAHHELVLYLFVLSEGKSTSMI